MKIKKKMEIIKLKIKDLTPYENNAKLHPKEQIEQIKNSIKQFGFCDPIGIWGVNNIIVEGHGRVKALEEMGETEVECIRLDYLTDEERKAYTLAHNKTTLTSGFDFDILEKELKELESMNLDFSMVDFGFNEEDFKIEPKQAEDDNFNEEQALEEIDEPTTKLGDVWQLGRHRLMCGDSTDRATIDKLMDGAKADMVFTDPPYGMNAVSKSGVLSQTYKTDILNDDTNEVAIESFLLSQDIFKNTKQVWWGANYYTECLPSAECWIVWDKNNGASDQTDCELAYTNFRSVVRQFTLASEKQNRVHPTQKPLKLIQMIFDKFDKQNELKNIVDLFGGSGSTLIACEQLDRKCYMLELDPKYCDVIINRWETLTGNKAKLLKE